MIFTWAVINPHKQHGLKCSSGSPHKNFRHQEYQYVNANFFLLLYQLSSTFLKTYPPTPTILCNLPLLARKLGLKAGQESARVSCFVVYNPYLSLLSTFLDPSPWLNSFLDGSYADNLSWLRAPVTLIQLTYHYRYLKTCHVNLLAFSLAFFLSTVGRKLPCLATTDHFWPQMATFDRKPGFSPHCRNRLDIRCIPFCAHRYCIQDTLYSRARLA